MAEKDNQPKEKKLTKKELRILQRQKQALEEAKAEADQQDTTKFGDVPLIQSQEMTDRIWMDVKNIHPNLNGKEYWIRGHLQNIRSKAKLAFLTIRQGSFTIQAVISQNDNDITKTMIKYTSNIPKESVIDIYAIINVPKNEIKSTTQKNVELEIKKIFIVSKSLPELPLQVEDAARSDVLLKMENSTYVDVGLDTRLNNRVLDLRTPTNNAIMRIQSKVCQFFREFLLKRNFIEIHTPKLTPGASEGGANCFTLKYFDQAACLAQSPQLYKQMACACAGFEKVFEIGPVFRAENSNTHRHLCEFIGLDFEMTIKEHYYEVLEVFSDLFIYIFDQINEKCKKELEIINEQHPFEPLKYFGPTLRLTYEEGVSLLNKNGIQQELYEDLSTENEKLLGKIVKDKYNTDFYILDKFPLAVRPFYTMPDPKDKKWSNSYDLMIRGEEIVSGAQRIHDIHLLKERMNEFGIPIKDVQAYVDSFQYGAQPHGGGGIGLERVVMLFLGLGNIRKTSMFPRDPKRLAP